MNILLIGGSGRMMDHLIIKLKKEGHRLYLLTGKQYRENTYEKVFEQFNFIYTSDNLHEIFESVNPDVTIFLGAYDTNYLWLEEREAVHFTSGLINILLAFSMMNKGRFLYLSSDEVFGKEHTRNITEEMPMDPDGPRGMAFSQAEKICENYKNERGLDIVILRLDHMYCIPKSLRDVDNLPSKMALEALTKGEIRVRTEAKYSLLYEYDAIEYIYRIVNSKKLAHSLYHISSSKEISEFDLAELIRAGLKENVRLKVSDEEGERKVLSNKRFEEEFGNMLFRPYDDSILKMVVYMRRHRNVFVHGLDAEAPWWKKLLHKWAWFIKALIPFLENLILFIPFFMLNNRAVGSDYFSKIDFYLFYVLLFAIVYGQQQATFSAILAVAGYMFRQMYTRSGFEIVMDYTTYVWIAQLFILGLVVGRMRDQVRAVKIESAEIQEHLNRQLGDIKDINSSNVRVKDVLEQQVIDQQDSIGKIYSITSTLDQYMPEEVLFYAVEILSQLLRSDDVAIYNVYNSSYARMFSASSDKARELGNSIVYTEMGEMYENLKSHQVYINRKLDKRYPLMANAVFENDEMKMIIMVWGLSWEKMTLGAANRLVVICYLIQNAVLSANRYMEALEESRYLGDTNILEENAFSSLVSAYQKAKEKKLTECTILQIETEQNNYQKTGEQIEKMLRRTDYLGVLNDGNLYVLLANTTIDEAQIVIQRFIDAGVRSAPMDQVET